MRYRCDVIMYEVGLGKVLFAGPGCSRPAERSSRPVETAACLCETDLISSVIQGHVIHITDHIPS